MLKIAPSIFTAEFSKLGEEIKEIDQGGADYVHIDVMDGHFVPNITIGPLIVEAIKPITTLPLEVHVMTENPDQYIPAFAKAGASIISVHEEACTHVQRTMQLIKSQGAKAGVVINRGTPVVMIQEIMSEVDLVRLMAVNSGSGGQSFIDKTVPRIEKLARMRTENNQSLEIQVDGGVNLETA